MSQEQARAQLAEVVRNEELPGLDGEPPVRMVALWVPDVARRIDFALYDVPEEERFFPLGTKLLLLERGEHAWNLKPLVPFRELPLFE